MKVKEVMTSPVQYCNPEDNLSAVAMKMWEGDYGILPVVSQEGQVIGMITDRDICMSVATKHKLASDISVWETISGQVYTCSPEEDVKQALSIMENKQVRRLPVTNLNGSLAGILSMNDIVMHAEDAKGKKETAFSYADVVETLEGICAHRPLVAR